MPDWSILNLKKVLGTFTSKKNEKKNELQEVEYPTIYYTRNGERFVDGEEFLRSKTGQELLDSAIKMKINSNANSNSRR